ncbi:adenosylcobinamide-phosphate synthase [Gemmobacter caeni]|uniref:Cobalamin biosynthesis protein CobD n=2 Tax=Gemmobacter caeni TaxID=589035 RepID=A0A2T5ZVY9_9RHOB|nr:adenosylcobinamide-phosphate synthase [Gemmobacter caeni]
MICAAMMTLALLLDICVGWPKWIFSRVGHPVTWIGALIYALERKLNSGGVWRRRIGGLICVFTVISICVVLAILLQSQLTTNWQTIAFGAVLAWPWIAAKGLDDHVVAVLIPLKENNVPDARQAVSSIVGRDTSTLDSASVTRAALESLAENACDGVVAPLFWGAVGGLPALIAYKALNTLDSMIGHRSPRFEDFGKVAARLDDLANFVPARLTSLLLLVASGRPFSAFLLTARDAGHHRSFNAGWPEASMAGGLDVRLSGPRTYGDQTVKEPWLNGGARDPQPEDLRRGLWIYRRSLALCIVALAILSFWERF